MYVKIGRAEIESAGGLTIGSYEIVLNPFWLSVDAKQMICWEINKHCPLEKNWQGKSWILRGARLEGINVVLRIKILQNPIPILAIVLGAGIILGGIVVWSILVEIRKLLTFENLGDLGKIVIPLSILLGLWLIWRKERKKK